MQIRLILLDFDGTLADTRRANTLAYVATLREAGYTLTEEEYAAKYFGMRCNEFLTRYGIADPGERERLRLRKIALYPAFFDTVRLNRPLWEFAGSSGRRAAAYGSYQQAAAPISTMPCAIWGSRSRDSGRGARVRQPRVRRAET